MKNGPSDYLKHIPAGLAKTGFVLEHEIAETFRRAGWTAINNRFYIDDVDGKSKELDLLVYKVYPHKEIEVVTAILVSCKKNKENAFVFMSRPAVKSEPNYDWIPVHYWTSNKLLNTYLSNSEWKDVYATENTELNEKIFEIKRHAFAAQLVSTRDGAPHNDKAIFDSVSGLMKALDHELSALPKRMKRNRIYIFNLITIVDAPLVDARFTDKKISPVEVEEFRYLARYIVGKREITARIHFIQKNSIEDSLKVFSSLSNHDKGYFLNQLDLAYKAITTNEHVRDYFGKLLATSLLWRINSRLAGTEFDVLESDKDIILSYDEFHQELVIELNTEPDVITAIAGDAPLEKTVAKLLKEKARYEGDFRFDVFSVPF